MPGVANCLVTPQLIAPGKPLNALTLKRRKTMADLSPGNGFYYSHTKVRPGNCQGCIWGGPHKSDCPSLVAQTQRVAKNVEIGAAQISREYGPLFRSA